MISRKTGQPIREVDHILQSIEMILTTPIGSRVMRRDFGSRLPRLVDAEMTPSNITAIYAATNEAISTWEPRVNVISTAIDADDASEGILKLIVTMELASSGEEVSSEFTI